MSRGSTWMHRFQQFTTGGVDNSPACHEAGFTCCSPSGEGCCRDPVWVRRDGGSSIAVGSESLPWVRSWMAMPGCGREGGEMCSGGFDGSTDVEAVQLWVPWALQDRDVVHPSTGGSLVEPVDEMRDVVAVTLSDALDLASAEIANPTDEIQGFCLTHCGPAHADSLDSPRDEESDGACCHGSSDRGQGRRSSSVRPGGCAGMSGCARTVVQIGQSGGSVVSKVFCDCLRVAGQRHCVGCVRGDTALVWASRTCSIWSLTHHNGGDRAQAVSGCPHLADHTGSDGWANSCETGRRLSPHP